MRNPEPSLTVRAYAKINWTLELLGRRADGYHEVRTILQNISLCDRITVTTTAGPDVIVQCPDPRVPAGPANLCHRAACLLQQAAAVPAGARIRLQKGIPVGAGLGGGSSDAAATLAALNRIWGLHWPLEQLTALAAQLGADVPFFLIGGTAVGTGRGDRIQALPGCPGIPLLLLEAPFELSTAAVYGQVQGFRADAGERTARLEELLRASRDRQGIAFLLINDLEEPACRLRPELRTRLAELRQAQVLAAGMSGSGPTLFALLPEAAPPAASSSLPSAAGWRLRWAWTVDRGWEPDPP
jgi:4-diphosphocytidyl-2-C-methyl-D-erythritol kinase